MKTLYTLLIFSWVLALSICSEHSFADGEEGQYAGHHGTHQYYHYHDHPHFGVHLASFYPGEYFSVWAGGARYYYDDGIYYSYLGGNYEVVAPPVGAVVSTIPVDFKPVFINGVTYYGDDATYYVRTSRGYQVVPAPR